MRQRSGAPKRRLMTPIIEGNDPGPLCRLQKFVPSINFAQHTLNKFQMTGFLFNNFPYLPLPVLCMLGMFLFRPETTLAQTDAPASAAPPAVSPAAGKNATLGGRKIVSRKFPVDTSGKTGLVVAWLCVDSTGHVISAVYREKESTTTDTSLVNSALRAARSFVFSASSEERQCGEVRFNFTTK